MSVVRRVAIGAGSQMAVRGVLMVVGLASFAIVARHLSVEGFGAYALVIAAVPLLATVVDFGIGTMAVREIAGRPEEAARIVATTFTILVAASACAVALAAVALPVVPYPEPVREALALAVPGLVALVLGAVPGIVFQSALRLELQALVDLVAGVAGFALIVLAVALDGGLHAIVGAWVASVVLATVLGYGLALRLLRFRPRFDRPLARRLVRRALPIGLAFVASAVHFRIDTVLLSLLRPIEDVAVYGVAFRFLEHGLFAPLLLMNALFPVLTGYLVRGDARLAPMVRKVFTLLLVVALPAAVAVVVLAEPLIDLLVGPGYEAAATPLRILGIAVIFAFVNPLFTNLLVAADLQGRVLAATSLAIVVNVGLNLVLIPRYSYNGAAAATAVSEALSVVLVAVWATRHTQVRPDWRLAGRVAVAAAAMGAVLGALSGLPVLVPIAAGAAVYLGLVALLRIVTAEDLRALRPAA